MKTPVLNRKVRLEEAYRTRDASGGFVTTWSAIGHIWARIDAGTGAEAETSGLTVSTVPYRIIVRAAPAGSARRPQPGQRLCEGDRIFNIHAVTEADPGAQYLKLFAREEEVSA